MTAESPVEILRQYLATARPVVVTLADGRTMRALVTGIALRDRTEFFDLIDVDRDEELRVSADSVSAAAPADGSQGQ